MDNIKVINKIIDLQLNEINKLNKLDIEFLEKQYNALKEKADNYYAKYLEEIESLYNMEMLGGGKDAIYKMV